ncbi:MAG: peptide-methionine (S)-S-oxide reductase [Parcubacteria group bacterium]|nr:peptide-methionine (S)-S-oxide reductase [Parcubacteria group bacterium]|tara:strand:- start:12369 stop:12914 length:546 start_codon:yes stop_codon:yes gene_type:complete
MKENNEIAIFGGGCFWCTEATFSQLKGVNKVTPGFAGGTGDVNYEKIHSDNTGHAEMIEVTFDPEIISYDDLLSVFFTIHDPTTINKQGADVGTEYRSMILYTSDDQKTKAEAMIKKLNDDNKTYDMPIVTEIKPLDKFIKAEDYHHNYYENNKDQPYCQIVINPKLEKLKEKHAELLKIS